MPFDSSPTKTLTREDKLNRLLHHLSLATDQEQKSYCGCLAHRCYVDPVLKEAGLPEKFWHYDPSTGGGIPLVKKRDVLFNEWKNFFGFSDNQAWVLFGAFPVEDKANTIREAMK